MNNLNRCAMKPTPRAKKVVSRKGTEKNERGCRGLKVEKKGRVTKSSLETNRRKNKLNQKNILNVVKKVCSNRPICANMLRINPSTDSIIYIGTVSRFHCESIIDLTKSSSNESLPSVKDPNDNIESNTSPSLKDANANNKTESNHDAVLQIDLKSSQTDDNSDFFIKDPNSQEAQKTDLNSSQTENNSDFFMKNLNFQEARSNCSFFNCPENAHELSEEDLNIIDNALNMEEEKALANSDNLENVGMENLVDVSMDVNTMCDLYYIDGDNKNMNS